MIAGYDLCDSTSAYAPVPPVVAAARQADVAGLRVGVVTELSADGDQPAVPGRFGEAAARLESSGAKAVERLAAPHVGYGLPGVLPDRAGRGSSNLARFDGVRYGLRVGDDGTGRRRGSHVAHPCGRIRCRGEAPDPARHLCAVGGYYDAYYGGPSRCAR